MVAEQSWFYNRQPVVSDREHSWISAADRKHKGTSIPASDAAASATTSLPDHPATDVEWSFPADVSPDDAEFDFEVTDGQD